MLLVLLLAVLPLDSIARESCDRIEHNLFYDDQARLVFEQLLFFDWSDHDERFQLRGWRMVKDQSQLPRLDHVRGAYVCHWRDGEIERIISAPVVSYSRTTYDPELEERIYLPKEKRRELLKPQIKKSLPRVSSTGSTVNPLVEKGSTMVTVVKSAFGVKPLDRIGKWTVLGELFSRGRGGNSADLAAVVECVCGQCAVVDLDALRFGRSPGCRKCCSGNRSHGMTQTTLYRRWRGIVDRCYRTTCECYASYGGRGISVCDEWRQSFEAFQQWSLANGYQPWLEIDRINTNGNYEPENCRWTTHRVNSNNRRNRKTIQAFGESKTVGEWACDDRCKVGAATLYSRVFVRGVEPERAITSLSLPRGLVGAQDKNRRELRSGKTVRGR